jgi:lipoyl-dependent peroxiredoxin
MKRTAKANWKGTGLEGTGTITTPASGLMNNVPFSFKARFVSEDGTLGTNPEELIAAAHASCFSMKLSFVLNKAGFTADEINTESVMTLENEGGWVAKKMTLNVTAKVPGVDAAQFAEFALDAKQNCPISKMLNLEIELNASLA